MGIKIWYPQNHYTTLKYDVHQHQVDSLEFSRGLVARCRLFSLLLFLFVLLNVLLYLAITVSMVWQVFKIMGYVDQIPYEPCKKLLSNYFLATPFWQQTSIFFFINMEATGIIMIMEVLIKLFISCSKTGWPPPRKSWKTLENQKVSWKV